MKELSVFIDESGDFGRFDRKSPYYIIGAVFLDQRNDISRQVRILNRRLAETALKADFVHLGPLIRREAGYKNLSPLEIKVYYDNGQLGVMKVLVAVFTKLFDNVEFRKALQKNYKMLQVADLICTAKLTELKMMKHTLSQSERRLLGSDRDIKKNLLRPLKRKEF